MTRTDKMNSTEARAFWSLKYAPVKRSRTMGRIRRATHKRERVLASRAIRAILDTAAPSMSILAGGDTLNGTGHNGQRS
jgi:hypothetical protein